MKKKRIVLGLIVLISFAALGQEADVVKRYHAGFESIKLVDKSRIYKPNSPESDSLHYRPVDLDIWYPSYKGNVKLTFGDLFGLFEQRANQYQDTDYTGIKDELVQLFAIESGLEVTDGQKLLQYITNSYGDATPSKESFPLIIYMAGFNGMGFENFKVLEKLAEKGFVVVSVWSVGRYPGNMTNHRLDMMEQIYDAEFAVDYLKRQDELKIDADTIGILGCSWGGMSAAVLANRNPSINTFVSFDGSETSYFGDSDEDDNFIKEICYSDLLDPEKNPLTIYTWKVEISWMTIRQGKSTTTTRN